MSIKTKKFPDIFKKAKSPHASKKSDKHDKSNYRPISILPVLSKIIERHVSEHVKSYLDSNKLLYERQSGIRKDHSCETALTDMVDDWITAIDRNEVVGTVFLDFSKAFDLVIPPVYEVYRGYIVFVFSVTMFVCLCLCVCVNFFFVKDFSGTTAPRILKVGTNVGYDVLYCVRENQLPPAYNSLYLSFFLSLQSKFLSQISQPLWEPESSNFVYILKVAKFIVGQKTKMLRFIFVFFFHFPFFHLSLQCNT